MMSAAERQRENRLKLLEDDIGRALAQSQSSGELQSAASWGKPMNLADGYAETPAELRMAYKILRDAGVVPAEVELMQRIAALQAQVDAGGAGVDLKQLQEKLAYLQAQLAMRLEGLRRSSSL